MKKILYGLQGLLLAAILQAPAGAQPEQLISLSEHPAKGIASAKIIAKFQKAFPAIQEEFWSKTQDGFSVRFAAEGKDQTAFLDKQGRCISVIRHYNENLLPKEIRHLVRSKYYDFTIKGVTEVSHNKTVAYLISIEDGKTIKVIRVIDGEMDEYQSFKKAG